MGVLPVEKTRVTKLPASMSRIRRLFRIQVRFSFARTKKVYRFLPPRDLTLIVLG